MYTPKGELNDELMKLVQDEESLKAFENCKSPEEGYEVVKRFLPNISMEEFQGNMQIMSSYLEESKDGLLSDDDLDEVAGGKSSSTKKDIKIATGVLSGAGAAAGVVAAVVSSLAFTA